MFFTASLYLSLAVFAIGLVFKVSTWFRYSLSPAAADIPTAKRVLAAVKGILLTVFSAKILTLLKVLVLDVLLQTRTLKESLLRWWMHMLIYGGFMLLLLMHALEKFISEPLFADYYSTLNPFLFLRNLSGVMVIAGIGLALYRRYISKLPRLKTNAMDHYAIIILAVIMVSGFLLEGIKITSYTRYQEMVEDYAELEEQEEIEALESYWVEYFGVVSSNVKAPFDQEVLSQGREIHEESCLDCHSRPQWAFTGYAVAKIIKPMALSLNRAGAVDILWYIHFMACFIGLAYLPFSKMFHIFASPLSLLANAVMQKGKSDPANIATRQVMELDACTHCCTCSLNCSAGVFFEHFPNPNILPSEKIVSIKALAAGQELGANELRHIQEGIYLCTNCNRCTVSCPVGINLQDLWFNVRESLLKKGYPEFFALSPLSFYRALMKTDPDIDNYQKPLDQAREAIADRCDLLKIEDKILPLSNTEPDFKGRLSQSDQAGTFLACFGCETCSTVCPVVANYENPREALGLLPHQIMYSCGLGLKDLALGSNMLWYCLTCYQCQEQCPQGVNVTDIIYELKNAAVEQVKKKVEL